MDGLTLREKVRLDRSRLQAGERLGARYWRSLAQAYSDNQEGIGALRPDRKDEKINDNLVDALGQALHVNPSSRKADPIIVYMQHTDGLNMTEAIGVLKAIAASSSIGLRAQDSLMLEYMKYLDRTGDCDKFQKLVEAFGPTHIKHCM